jgi:hypothetical protein
MAPNILRESNEKEVKNVDQGAVKVVFDLIENNDEFSEVPPEIMELLSDEVSDMSAKEIMRQWEQRGKNPMSATATSPRSQDGTASRKDQRNAPQITTADNNPSAQPGSASARQAAAHAAGPSNNPQRSPVPGHDVIPPNPAFGQDPQASAESHRTASPHRHSYRSPQYQKQIGTAGAS